VKREGKSKKGKGKREKERSDIPSERSEAGRKKGKGGAVLCGRAKMAGREHPAQTKLERSGFSAECNVAGKGEVVPDKSKNCWVELARFL
jgi:hypothetical protein